MENPEDPTAGVIAVLVDAGQADEATRNAASAQLMAYFKEPGFASVLVDIIAQKEQLDQEIRLRAALNLKVIVTHFYGQRSDSEYVISDEEKAALRQSVPPLLDNDSLEIYTALSLVVAIMAKHDFPMLWPELLVELNSAISTAQQPTSYLMALYYVVKMISGLDDMPEYREFESDTVVRTSYDLKIAQLREFSPTIVMTLVTMWGEMTAKLVSQIGAFLDSEGKNRDAIELRLCYDCYYGFRILRLLLVSYLPTLSSYNPNFLVEFCTMIASRIENLALLVRQTQNYPGSSQLNKLYIALIKFVTNIQAQHPLTFTSVLLSFLNYFMKEFCDWKDEWRGIAVLEAPLIYYMRFIASVLATREYGLAYLEQGALGRAVSHPDQEVATAEAVQDAHHIVSTFFSPQTLIYLLQTIVGRFFKIQPDRYEVWEQAPEVFWEEDLTDSNYSILHSAEEVFYRLFTYDRDLICNEVMRMIQQVRANCAKENPEEVPLDDILLKDACMITLAHGASSFSSSELIDFDVMLEQMIEPDLAVMDPRYRTIRRSIAKIICAWVDDISLDLHKRTWEILLVLLADPDPIVKCTALSATNELLSTIDWDYEPYSSCVKPNVEYLLAMLREYAETPFARIMLSNLSKFVVHLADRISPYTEPIVDHITEFWDIADRTNQQDLKQSIVAIFASLTESLPDYRGIYNSLIHIARQTTDLSHPDSILLLEAGLRLWWNLVQTSDDMTDDLVHLFPRILHIYSSVPHKPDITSMSIRLLESYAILGNSKLIADHVDYVASLLEQLVLGAPLLLIQTCADLLITFFQLFPDDAPSIVRPALARLYHTMFYRFPTRTKVVTKIGSLFMHIVHKNINFFFEFLSDPSIDPEVESPLSRLLSRLIEVWNLVDYIEPEKVWAFGFSRLFASGNPVTVQLSPQLVDVAVSLILTLRKHSKTVELRKQHTEYSDVIALKGSTVDKLRREIRRNDLSKLPLETVQQEVMNNIVSTLQAQGPEFEQQVAAAVQEHTRQFLTQYLADN